MFKKFNNKQQWKRLLKDTEISLELKEAIKHFLLIDNIDFEKYLENSRANDICLSGTGLDNWEMSNKLSAIENIEKINCSQTFRKHYANDSLHRSPFLPNWYYIGYPDVAVWFNDIKETYGAHISINKHKYITNNAPNNNLYRFIINEYLKEHKYLECSL